AAMGENMHRMRTALGELQGDQVVAPGAFVVAVYARSASTAAGRTWAFPMPWTAEAPHARANRSAPSVVQQGDAMPQRRLQSSTGGVQCELGASCACDADC